jgi:hypothetical protein
MAFGYGQERSQIANRIAERKNGRSDRKAKPPRHSGE